jgi:formate/nitrite transporter FocA (FNT family)
VNLIPVTIGNIIGGALMIGFVYWFLYGPRFSRPKVIPSSVVSQIDR